MKKLKYIILLFCLIMMSGCSKNNIPIVYKHYVNNRNIYIANIGLGSTDLSSELTKKGTPRDKITILDEANSKENFFPTSIIEVNALVFMVIEFNEENMKKKNTSFEEELQRAQSFSHLKNFCSLIVIAIGNKDFHLADTPYLSFKELNVMIEVADYSKAIIFIEGKDEIQYKEQSSFNINKLFKTFVRTYFNNQTHFLFYHSYKDFIYYFVNYIY